jgi:hypothetical protein
MSEFIEELRSLSRAGGWPSEPLAQAADALESQARDIDRLEKENQAHAKHREAVTKSGDRVDAAFRAYIESLENQVAELQARAQSAEPVQGEPVAYAAFADNGNIRMWCRSAIGMCELFDAHGNKAVPLYTSPAKPDADQKVNADILDGYARMFEEEAARNADLVQCLKFARATMATVAENANLRGVENRSLMSEVKRIDAKLAEVNKP